MRAVATAACLTMLATLGHAAGEKSLGLAQSESAFKIQRSSKSISGRSGSLVPVEAGDRLRAADKHVQVQTQAGDAILLQIGAEAEFPKPDAVRLIEGDVLVATHKGRGVSVSIEDLLIQPIGEAKDKNPFMVAVRRVNPNEVRLTGFGNAFAVRIEGSQDQLAVLGNQDLIKMTKGERGWTVAQATTAAEAAKPGEGEPVEEEDETGQKKKRRSVAGWWNPSDPASAGLGAAAAPGATVFSLNPNFMGPVTIFSIGGVLGFVVNDQLGKSKNNDRGGSRNTSSQIEPTETPVETPVEEVNL